MQKRSLCSVSGRDQSRHELAGLKQCRPELALAVHGSPFSRYLKILHVPVTCLHSLASRTCAWHSFIVLLMYRRCCFLSSSCRSCCCQRLRSARALALSHHPLHGQLKYGLVLTPHIGRQPVLSVTAQRHHLPLAPLQLAIV